MQQAQTLTEAQRKSLALTTLEAVADITTLCQTHTSDTVRLANTIHKIDAIVRMALKTLERGY